MWGATLNTSKKLCGGRELCVGQSWINKVKGGRSGAQEVSVLLSSGDDGGDDGADVLFGHLARSDPKGKDRGDEKVLGLREKFQRGV